MNENTESTQAQGWSAIPNWVVWDESISGRAKLVYMCLNSRASRRGDSFPSHAKMAKESGLSVTTVKLALEELRSLGIVSWEKRSRPDGGQSSNMYFLTSMPLAPGRNPTTP